MRDHFVNLKFLTSFLLATSIALLAGCSDNTGGAGNTAGGGNAGGGNTPPVATSSLTLALTDSAGTVITSISNGTSANVKATLKNASDAPVANTVVTFTTPSAIATMSPASGTALTDGAGVATITLTGGATSGATTIAATAQVGNAAVSGSIGYSVGATSLTISKPIFGVNPLSAFGTTSVEVTVSSGGTPVATPQTVTFSSPCSVSGKAVLSVSVVTVNGKATGSYRDNGCAGTDTVTASVSGTPPVSAALDVIAPTIGSIQFVSATPANITLKGTGGAGRQESSRVVFKVVDTGGNPLSGKTVDFSLSTSVGGITFATGGVAATAISGSDGQVLVTVNSGTSSTPVRVQASTCATSTNPCTGKLSTQSDKLTITTGIPDQQNFSLSATTKNIEGWDYDGITTVITARMADHFNNPVPDGTSVVFTAEGGSIASTCDTVGGGCSATLTSQALRPANGRVTVLAYAVGEEGFSDINGNGLADQPVEMKDANGISTDMNEAYVDWNENGTRDVLEPYIDFNGDGTYNVPDGKYNGVLCDSNVAPSSVVACNAQKAIHVRGSIPIVFSGSDAITQIKIPVATFDLFNCGASIATIIDVRDVNGSAMPAGTKIDVSTSNGTVVAPFNFIVANTNKVPLPYEYTVTVLSDGVITPATLTTPAICNDPTPAGKFTVTVTTPLGKITRTSFDVIN